jgi:hypothetical protein
MDALGLAIGDKAASPTPPRGWSSSTCQRGEHGRRHALDDAVERATRGRPGAHRARRPRPRLCDQHRQGRARSRCIRDPVIPRRQRATPRRQWRASARRPNLPAFALHLTAVLHRTDGGLGILESQPFAFLPPAQPNGRLPAPRADRRSRLAPRVGARARVYGRLPQARRVPSCLYASSGSPT